MKLRSTVVMIPFLACVQLAYGDPPEPQALLDRMTAAADSIDTFAAAVTVEEQWRMSNGVFLDEPDWLEPHVSCLGQFLVSGERYYDSFVLQVSRTGKQKAVERGYDGAIESAYTYALGTTRFRGYRRHEATRWNEGALQDPRELAYRTTRRWSRIAYLHQFVDAGKMVVSEATLEGEAVFLVEAFGLPRTAETPDNPPYAFRIWVAPSRGFLPLRIEEHKHKAEKELGDLVYRYDGIEHVEAEPGVWFPVRGVLEHIEYRDPQNKGKVRSTVTLEVAPDSLDLHPDTSPAAFQVDFPPGMTVEDHVAGTRYIVEDPGGSTEASVQAILGPTRELLATQPAEGQGQDGQSTAGTTREEQDPSPVQPVTASSGRPTWGRYGVWCGCLMIVGALAAWLLFRKKRPTPQV